MTLVLALLGVVVGGALGAAVATSVQRRRCEMAVGRIEQLAVRHGVDLDAHPGTADDLDRVVELVSVALTLGERRMAEAAAVESRLAGALDALARGVLVTDAEGMVVFRNTAAAEFHGARHGEALVEAAIAELLIVAVSGEPVQRTVELFGPPRRVLVVTAEPLVDDDNLIGAVAQVEDLTDRRRLEDVRRDFVANISHELKTPVGALSLLAETIAAETEPELSRRLAERMVGEASRVANTIDDLLVLSQIEGGELIEHTPVAVASVMAEALERVGPAAAQRRIRLELAEPDPGVAVLADRRQVVSALHNLLDNATKYSDEGSTVVLSAVRVNGSVELVVADAGIGIPAKDLERVFERFYRVDQARSRQTGGTGLGLSIVRHVAVNHAGEVRVESRLGEGSTFTLCLPAAKSQEPESQEPREDV